MADKHGACVGDGPQSRSGCGRVFFGAGGLRLGWSIALYWVMFGVIAAVENWLADSLQLGKLWSQMFGELGALVAAVIPALVLARIERRPWGDYGLPLRQAFSKLFWVGVVWGFLGITLLLEILHGLHAFDFGHVVLHGITIVRYAIFWGVVFLLVGLVEEFLFRGYTLFTLGRGLGFWPAAALLSIGFGAIHLNNHGEAWTGALAAGLIGFFFCLTLRRTGSLWFAVGFHAAWDWGESFFYSVPDSGAISPDTCLVRRFMGRDGLQEGRWGRRAACSVFW